MKIKAVIFTKVSIQLFCILFAIVVLGSCQPKSSTDLSYERIKNDQAKAAQKQWSQSYATVDFSLDLNPYFQKLNERVPNELHKSAWKCEGVSYELNAWRKPLLFNGQDEIMECNTELAYQLQLNYCPKCTYVINEKGTCLTPRIKGSCGLDDAPKKAAIGFSSSFSILPNYSLKSATKLSNLELIDPCEITFASIDITPQLKAEIMEDMGLVTKAIDDKISEVPLLEVVQATWRELQQPLLIPSYGNLTFDPKTIAIGDYSFKRNILNFPIELSMEPVFYTTTIEGKKDELPSMTKITNRKGFDLSVQMNLGYDSLGRFLTRSLNNKLIEFSKQTIQLDSVKSQPGVNGKLDIFVYFSGDQSGSLYLSGTPCLNELKQALYFPNLTYKLRFKNVLIALVTKFYKQSISNALKDAMNLPLDSYLNDLRKEIDASINQELKNDMQLSGTVENLKLTHVDVTQAALITYIRLVGKMKLSL